MKVVKFQIRQGDYNKEETRFLITRKDVGTAPNINVEQAGEFTGHIVLSESGAQMLIDALSYLVGNKK